jgi:riboflavin biosynthesis pyrimidine reductase
MVLGESGKSLFQGVNIQEMEEANKLTLADVTVLGDTVRNRYYL